MGVIAPTMKKEKAQQRCTCALAVRMTEGNMGYLSNLLEEAITLPREAVHKTPLIDGTRIVNDNLNEVTNACGIDTENHKWLVSDIGTRVIDQLEDYETALKNLQEVERKFLISLVRCKRGED